MLEYQPTPRELQLLSILTTPMTAMHLCAELDISYAHGITVIRKLKRKGFVHETVKQQDGKIFYMTARLPETEPLYIAHERNLNSEQDKTLRIFWEGIPASLREVMIGLMKAKIEDERELDFIKVLGWILQALTYNSFLSEQGHSQLYPYPEDLKRALIRRINQERKNLKFAELLLQAPIWENENSITWKRLTPKEPPESHGNAINAIQAQLNKKGCL